MCSLGLRFSTRWAAVWIMQVGLSGDIPDSNVFGQWLGPIWQVQLGKSLVMLIGPRGPSIKYIKLFWTNFSPCHTSRDPQIKYVTHLGPPIFSSRAYMHTYICRYRGFVLVHGGFCSRSFVRGFLSGRFCPGWFCPSPSVIIHLLQQKAKHHFQF